MQRRIVALVALCALSISSPLVAQKARKVPERPAVTGDRNDPLAYYRLGLQLIEVKPDQSAAALYWATQLDPSWAPALYARRIAELRANERNLIRYMDGDRKARREFAGVDSLFFRARMIEPFLAQDLDKGLVTHYLNASISEGVRRSNPTAAEGEIRYAVESYVDEMLKNGRNPSLLGWLAFSEGRYGDALGLYAKAIGKKHESPGLHDDRATIFFKMQNYDSAASELEHALAESKKENEKETEVIYRPRALLHYRMAHVQLRQNKLAEARESLGHALEEDLSFYPAHMTLANLALATGDTATATQEMQLAVDLNPQEALPFMRQAELLSVIGQADAAQATLEKVVAMAPYYASPYLELGRLAHKAGRTDAAIEHYRNFLQRAPAGSSRVQEATQRIVALGGKP
ncbi:MAG: tetratricopeptide repeat protein [Gemmatimonadales bacterium]